MQLAERDDAAREPELDSTLDRIVTEGSPRLHRSWYLSATTGFVAGLEVALGVLAMLYVKQVTDSQALAGVAFSIGFIALLLGHSELFTEGFLTPVAVVAARRARLRDAVKLWFWTLVGNLAGGLLLSWFAMRAFPTLHSVAITSGRFFATAGWSQRSFCLALLAGMGITLMTRMQNGTESVPAKLLAAIAIAFLLAGLRLFHSILDSLVIFFALEAGGAHFGFLDWLRFLSVAVVGNVTGGMGFTTLFRLIRSRQRLIEHRVAVEDDVPLDTGSSGRRSG